MTSASVIQSNSRLQPMQGSLMNRQMLVAFVLVTLCLTCAEPRAAMPGVTDPRNLVFCPYAIVLYVVPGEPDRVYVVYRKPLATGSPRSMQALREVGKLLDGIARDALK